MHPKSISVLFAFATALPSYAGIDLTPVQNEYVANGATIRALNFKDDKRRIDYEPPQGWTLDGSANQLRLKPPQKNFAEAVIAATPLVKPQPLDENTIKPLEEQFIAALPVGSQFAKLEEEISNPVLLDGNPSFEITVSYQLNGERFLRSALFVNLPDTQLVFRLAARKDDFAALHREFKASIFSWHWKEPEQVSSTSADQPSAQ